MSRLVVVLACTLLLAGCLAPPAADQSRAFADEPTNETVGWVDGYDPDDSIDVDPSNGLNDSELDAYVTRTMARVEVIRGLPFVEDVPVEVISREEYRNRTDGGDPPPEVGSFRNQVWEALFLVDEETDATAALQEVYGSSVQGYYAPSEGQIVIVSDSPENLTVDRRTLVHELVHALQDQHLGLDTRAPTMDERNARLGATEGDANYVQFRYEDRCEVEWDCLPIPDDERVADREYDLGVFLVVFHPYSDGPAFVDALRADGGWERVNGVIGEDHPESTEQVIHPGKFGADSPREVTVPDRSSERWSRFAGIADRDQPAETVGESSLYATFWANGIVERSHVRTDDHPDSRYNYSHPITHGWDGDLVVPYRSDDGEYGYVFASVWDGEENATEFREAYEQLLVDAHGAEEVREGVYRIPEDSPFGDAFRVTQDGNRVVVVNAPSVAELDGVHETNRHNST